jgi:hypothetical protein
MMLCVVPWQQPKITGYNDYKSQWKWKQFGTMWDVTVNWAATNNDIYMKDRLREVYSRWALTEMPSKFQLRIP